MEKGKFLPYLNQKSSKIKVETMNEEDLSENINNKIEEIQDKVLKGKITLLEQELVPLFTELRNTVSSKYLDQYSKTYKSACDLLDKKFQELKVLLNSFNKEKELMDYLETEPEDIEIYSLFEGCWRATFSLNSLSIRFLDESFSKLTRSPSKSVSIKHLEKATVDEEFLLEIPKKKFTEKMENFFEKIIGKLPCYFEDIFEGITNQAEIYEVFVYILHLIQQKIIKYQKETNTLYAGDLNE